MTLQEVLDAKAANKQVSYNGQPVDITKTGPQMTWVTDAQGNKHKATPDELSPL